MQCVQAAAGDELSDDSECSQAAQVPCAQMKVVRVRRLGSLPAQLTPLSPQVYPPSRPAAHPATISCMAALHHILLVECALLLKCGCELHLFPA